ncbi:MAG: 23S rRNA (adenine(2503)-C(2))-methyltransferase RlmN [Christensenellales bacterium]|jgi:23S rRNA (adenine2503-C2)-methyltransferase
MIIADYTLEELKELMKSYNEPAYRARQLFEAVYEGKCIDEITNIGKGLKDKIKYLTGVGIDKKFVSSDGTVKYLFKLCDNALIEGVFMRYKHGNTICISTQAGCRMNCLFCASGISGLERNLSAGEMVGQVVAVNRDNGGTAKQRAVKNIVLMGSGEPLDNYDNTLKFIRLITDENSINIGARNISLSTCGLVDKMYKLAEENIQINLTLSLHAPNDEIRNNIMPVNKAYGVKALIKALRNYYEKTGRRVIIEYALIDGINDTDDNAAELAELVKGFPCHINLIRLNYVHEKKLRGSKRVKEFMQELKRRNVSVTLRRSMGGDIQGACGQLRSKYAH